MESQKVGHTNKWKGATLLFIFLIALSILFYYPSVDGHGNDGLNEILVLLIPLSFILTAFYLFLRSKTESKILASNYNLTWLLAIHTVASGVLYGIFVLLTVAALIVESIIYGTIGEGGMALAAVIIFGFPFAFILLTLFALIPNYFFGRFYNDPKSLRNLALLVIFLTAVLLILNIVKSSTCFFGLYSC